MLVGKTSWKKITHLNDVGEGGKKVLQNMYFGIHSNIADIKIFINRISGGDKL
jgi:hypothetical protein